MLNSTKSGADLACHNLPRHEKLILKVIKGWCYKKYDLGFIDYTYYSISASLHYIWLSSNISLRFARLSNRLCDILQWMTNMNSIWVCQTLKICHSQRSSCPLNSRKKGTSKILYYSEIIIHVYKLCVNPKFESWNERGKREKTGEF